MKMKSLVFVFCCLLQSIYSSGYSLNLSDLIIYPPAKTSPRIVGGKVAPVGYVPYQCSMQIKGKHSCGCAIISNEWIITAAHCFRYLESKDIEVLVGTNDLREGGRRYKTKRFILHENFDNPLYGNDIAVLQVNGSIEFNDQVQPIEIAMEEIPEGTELELTGWGQLKKEGASPHLLQIVLKASGKEECKQKYGDGTVGPDHLCTFVKTGVGACQGDSGGPLVIRNSSGIKIVGVVNFGVPCAVGYPDVFARTSYFNNWIETHIAGIKIV